MANKKISELDQAVSLDGTEELAMAKNWANYKATAADIAKVWMVTSISTESTDDEFPSALAVFTAINDYGLTISVVSVLPATWSARTLYLVPNGWEWLNVYDEYIWTGSAFEKVWSTQVDLTPYVRFDSFQAKPYATSIWASGLTSTSTSNSITLTAGTVNDWMEYVVKITPTAAGTITLWTWVNNPYGRPLTLTANKTTIVCLIATSSSTLDIWSINTAL